MNNKKTIWIICQYAGSRYHGMNYRPYYIGKELIKNGHDVHVFSGSYSHQYVKLPEMKGIITDELIDGMLYHWIKTPRYRHSLSPMRLLSWFIFVWRLLFIRTKKITPPDTIIVSSPVPYPIFAGRRLSRYYSARLIFEVRDIWPLSLIKLGNTGTKNPIISFTQRVEDYAYKHSDIVVSVLPLAFEHMKLHGLEKSRFVCIPNGIDLSERGMVEELDQETSSLFPQDKFIVGYIGTFGVANNLEILLRTASLLKENKSIHFILVGDGVQKESLVSSKDSGSLQNVTFIDPVKKVMVPAVLRRFDVCFIGWKKIDLYRYGISANKIFDYMYAGKPVIHAVSAGNDPVDEAGGGVKVEPENPDEIKNAILYFFEMDKSDLERIGAKGRQYVVEKHSYESLGKKYTQIV